MGLLGSLVGKVRCPACGSYERHYRDKEEEAEIREDNRDEGGLGLRKQTPRAFVCRSCLFKFNLNAMLVWSKIAKNAGEEEALAEMQRLLADHSEEDLAERYASADDLGDE